MNSKTRFVVAACFVILPAVGLVIAHVCGAFSAPGALVVYCAHDAEFSAEILREFTQQTGIPVEVRYDSEATKSLGLVNLLVQEKEHPRCDVFWNNQVLTTIDLFEQGVLLPYRGTGFSRIPAAFKEPGGHWAGFAARMRIYIINTGIINTGRMEPTTEKLQQAAATWGQTSRSARRMEPTAEKLQQALAGDLSRMAIAKPLYGTTLSHYALLWHVLGRDALQAWHRDIHARGVREVDGNATVKNLVAEGVCDFGLTDTDDFFAALDEGKPVAMLPVRVEGKTICIPNSVAIIRGTQRLADAQRLVDYLLSAETELALARSKARQIPLGPVDANQLPAEVRELQAWAQDGYDFGSIGTAHRDCLRWLKSEYLR